MSTEEMWGDLMEALKLEDEIKSLIELHGIKIILIYCMILFAWQTALLIVIAIL